jgi:hypothetical protein
MSKLDPTTPFIAVPRTKTTFHYADHICNYSAF